MPDIWFDVDTALAEVPVNLLPLLDDTDFKSIENAVAYNATGLALYWHFVTTAGAYTVTAVTPTTGGDYDWTDQGDAGIYTIEMPASGGASINNDTEGFGWFTGKATGVLPWRGPVIGFRAAALNNSLIDGATIDVNVTAVSGDTAAADNLESYCDGTTPIPANATQISGDATAADNAEAALDGTGYGFTNCTMPTTTTLTNKTGFGLAADQSGVTIGTVNTLAANALTATAIAADAITAAKLAADVTTELQSGLATATELAKVPKSDGNTTWNATALASINAEVDAALNTAIPGSPTADSINERVKALDDHVTADYTATEKAAIDLLDDASGGLADIHTDLATVAGYVDTEVAAILEDTGTTIPTLLSGLATEADIADAVLDELLADHTGAGSLSKGITDILEDTSTTLDDLVDGLESDVGSVKTVTDHLATTIELDGEVYRFTTNALEQAPTGEGSGASAAEVWGYETRALTDKTGFGLAADQSGVTIGTVNALAAGALSSIWAVLTSGLTGAGSIGKYILDHIVGTLSAGSHTAQTGDAYAIVNNGTYGNSAIKTETAAINAKTTNLPAQPAAVGSAMTLSDNAITAAKIAADAVTAAKLAADVTTELQSGLATATELAKVPKSDGNTTWNATALASINAEVDAALNTAIPGSPTADSINERVKALDDHVTADYTATEKAAIDLLDDAEVGLADIRGAIDTTAGYVDTEVTSIKTVTDHLATAIEADGEVYRFTENALEQAPAGASAEEVWTYATRALTDKAGFALTAAYDRAKTAASAAEVTAAAADVSVDEIQATALADLFNTDSGTTYAAAVAGSVVKETADNAGGTALTVETIREEIDDNSTQLAAIRAKTDLLGAASVTVTSPVAESGSLTIYQGDDYAAAEGRGLTFNVEDTAHVLGLDDPAAEVRLNLTQASWTATSVTSTASGYTVVFEPSSAETAVLTQDQQYELEATTAAGHIVTLARGIATVVHDIPEVGGA